MTKGTLGAHGKGPGSVAPPKRSGLSLPNGGRALVKAARNPECERLGLAIVTRQRMGNLDSVDERSRLALRNGQLAESIWRQEGRFAEMLVRAGLLPPTPSVKDFIRDGPKAPEKLLAETRRYLDAAARGAALAHLVFGAAVELRISPTFRMLLRPDYLRLSGGVYVVGEAKAHYKVHRRGGQATRAGALIQAAAYHYALQLTYRELGPGLVLEPRVDLVMRKPTAAGYYPEGDFDVDVEPQLDVLITQAMPALRRAELARARGVTDVFGLGIAFTDECGSFCDGYERCLAELHAVRSSRLLGVGHSLLAPARDLTAIRLLLQGTLPEDPDWQALHDRFGAVLDRVRSMSSVGPNAPAQ